MFARAAFDLKNRVWGVFNSSQLHTYFRAQGHAFEREYVFEPRLSAALKPFIDAGPVAKDKRILVYGRPSIPRNCFPAIIQGLRAWTERYSQFAEWSVTSAGSQHRPVPIGGGRELRSRGKLSLEDYGQMLRTTAVGISLMSSPHPSYPPLEMAHFGVRTLTNRYFCKDLSRAHDNIVSLPDIAPGAIADALAAACAQFEAAPQSGWEGRSHVLGYLEQGAYPFLDRLAADIVATAGRGSDQTKGD
jgi:beta-1,2-rhamnosyltransferase WsaF-like protein